MTLETAAYVIVGFAFTEWEVKPISGFSLGYNIILIPYMVISFPIGGIVRIDRNASDVSSRI